jgi:hypothetical protein
VSHAPAAVQPLPSAQPLGQVAEGEQFCPPPPVQLTAQAQELAHWMPPWHELVPEQVTVQGSVPHEMPPVQELVPPHWTTHGKSAGHWIGEEQLPEVGQEKVHTPPTQLPPVQAATQGSASGGGAASIIGASAPGGASVAGGASVTEASASGVDGAQRPSTQARPSGHGSASLHRNGSSAKSGPEKVQAPRRLSAKTMQPPFGTRAS